MASEVLAKQFGLKEPPSISELKKVQATVSLKSLVANGLTMSLDQYFKERDAFEAMPQKEKQQLVKDR